MRHYFLLAVAAALLVRFGPAWAEAPPRGRVCLSPAETRDAVAVHKLTAPFAALKSASQLVKADPLRSRLCRWDDEYVYEMTLLPKDGKVVVVFMDAAAGRAVNTGDARMVNTGDARTPPVAGLPPAAAPVVDR